MEKFRTHGVCSREIQFEVDSDSKLTFLKFVGGCPGNLQGISKLCIGRTLDEIIDTLQGINCRAGTSCPDQLAKALMEYKSENA
ncbi:MAG: TIGR03905 family TSCPD domain-containing protein [Bacillota bacterium]